jgi:type VI protein secretion system component VasF
VHFIPAPGEEDEKRPRFPWWVAVLVVIVIVLVGYLVLRLR